MPNETQLARRVAAAFSRRGKPIVVRRLTRLSGREPLPNPPTLNAPVIDGGASAGASVVAIRGTEAVGRMIAGDVILIGAGRYTVQATVNAREPGAASPGFDAIPIAPALSATLADGVAVSFIWSADVPVYARIRAFPRNIADGELIETRDLQVLIAAYGLGMPQGEWRLIIDGEDFSIVSKQPVFAGSTIVEWDLQAR